MTRVVLGQKIAADKAIGASNVKSYVATATGWIGSPGQQFAQGDLPRADLKSYTVTTDYPSKSQKRDYVRVQGNNPLRGGGGIPIQGEQHATEFVSGSSAWNLNAQGQPVAQQANVAGDRQLMIMANPIGFIEAGLAAPNAAATDRYFGRENRTVKVVAFNVKVCDGPQPQCTRRLTGEFNNDNMLERVITWIPDPVLGDKMVELRYSDYRDVGGGTKFPFHIHMHKGDHPLLPGGNGRNWLDVQISSAKVNVANAVQAVPDSVRSAPVPKAAVKSQKLADKVWLMAGSTHNSVAVEFRDFIAIVESPLDDELAQNDDFSPLVIAEAKRVIPNKPIRYLINSHHHFDHLGGARTYAAEGAIIVTQERNREFLEKVILVPQPRTLNPDRFSQFPFATTGPGPLPIETVSEQHAISDGQKTMLVFHVQGLDHNQNMLAVYLPEEKILINADLWGPPQPGAAPPANVSQGAVALYNNIKRLRLDVALHVPIHGRPGPNADFERIVGPVAARQRPAGGQGG